MSLRWFCNAARVYLIYFVLCCIQLLLGFLGCAFVVWVLVVRLCLCVYMFGFALLSVRVFLYGCVAL